METQSCHDVCKSQCCSHHWAALIGRILMGAVFILAAVYGYSYWQTSLKLLTDAHLPYPAIALSIALLLKFLGGISLLLGYKTRVGVLLLLLFVIPATLLFHDFWNLSAELAQQASFDFFRNIFFVGALLFVAGFGPGCYSIDACCACKHRDEV